MASNESSTVPGPMRDRRHLRINDWQNATSSSKPHESGIVERLFQTCSKFYSHLLQILKQSGNPADTAHLHLSNSMLRLWGNDFLEDEVDIILLRSLELRDSVISILRSILVVLSHRLTRYAVGSEGSFSDQDQDQLNVSTVLEEAEAAMSGALPNDDDYTELASNTEDDSLDNVLEDLGIYVQCLVDLGPSIELCAQYDRSYTLEEAMPGSSRSATLAPPHYYSELIRAKFTNADERLVEALGKLNWERRGRIRASKEAGLEQEGVINVDEVAPSVVDGSQFHDSGIGSSLPSQSAYAPTIVSFSKRSVSGTFQSRIPPLPETARNGTPFTCVGCGRIIQARSTRDYFKHVYKDIQPYACFYDRMSCIGRFFDDRESWINHLHSEHGFAPGWARMKCPLCTRMIPAGQISISDHLGRHMESIAEAALPLDADSDSDSDANSETSPKASMEIIQEDELGLEDIAPHEDGKSEETTQPIKDDKASTTYKPGVQWFQPEEGRVREVVEAYKQVFRS